MRSIRGYLKETAALTTEYIIGLAVAMLVFVAIMPTVLNGFNASTITGWASSVQTMWGLIPVLIIVAVILVLAKGHRK